jgi:stringent starvation protein B
MEVYEYSERSVVAIGEHTKLLKDHLKAIGGKFNPNLTIKAEEKQKGWVFSIRKKDELLSLANKSIDEIKSIAERANKSAENAKMSRPPEIEKGTLPFIYPYNKAFVVLGDSRKFRNELKELGGKFNIALKYKGVKVPGWVFSNSNSNKIKVETLLKSGTVSNEKKTKSEIKAKTGATIADVDIPVGATVINYAAESGNMAAQDLPACFHPTFDKDEGQNQEKQSENQKRLLDTAEDISSEDNKKSKTEKGHDELQLQAC